MVSNRGSRRNDNIEKRKSECVFQKGKLERHYQHLFKENVKKKKKSDVRFKEKESLMTFYALKKY